MYLVLPKFCVIYGCTAYLCILPVIWLRFLSIWLGRLLWLCHILFAFCCVAYMVVPQKNKVASPNMLALLSFAYHQYGCTFYWYGCTTSYVYQYGCATSYGCATDCLRFLASPMDASPKNMVAPPNIWLCLLALRDIDMVAPSINMVAPLVMVAPPIFCIWLHCLWLHLQKLWLHRFHNHGCTV